MLKHRRRRERAERRLAATAENLERLGDLVREVRRQIRPLERQAAAARSHDSVASELLAVRRYLAGAEQADLTTRRRAAAQDLTVCRDEERELHDVARAARRRGHQHDRRAVVASRRGSRQRAGPGAGAGRAGQRPLGCAARTGPGRGGRPRRRRRRRRGLDPRGGGGPPGQRAGGRRGRGGGGRRARTGGAGPRWPCSTRRQPRFGSAGPAILGGDAPDQAIAPGRGPAPRRLPGPQCVSRRTSTPWGRGWAPSSSARRAPPYGPTCWPGRPTSSRSRRRASRPSWPHGARARGGGARAAESAQVTADEAEEARHRTAARAEALERALADLQGAGGRELLRDVDGVVGSLVDLVEIDEGWDAAFEAAIGAGVAAVVVDGRRSAQAALTTLREGGVTGAVLAPRQSSRAQRRRRPAAGQQRRAGATPRPGVPGGSVADRSWTRSSGGPSGSTAGRRPSTSRWPATTSSWSRPRATGSPPRMAGALGHERRHGGLGRGGPPAGGRGRRRRRAGPGAAHGEPDRARPGPRRSHDGGARRDRHALRLRDRTRPTGSARPRSSAAWPLSSTRRAPRWAWPTSD